MLIKQLLHTEPSDQEVVAQGWVRTRRDAKDFSFIELNDGSCLKNLQVIAGHKLTGFEETVLKLSTGCAVRVTGRLTASPAAGQAVELTADSVEVLGWADPETYPLQKKRHSFEFLREIAHLRPRTNSLGAMLRVRSSLSQAVHQFFQAEGFFQVHTPVITTSDCEGAGEMFTVTTLSGAQLGQGSEPFKADFFGRRAGLTVSGQLEAEALALALGRVYTFGPTFRAENSNTSRHLAEFWMIEPEMAFCDLTEDAALAERFLRYLVRQVLDHCGEELELFGKFIDKGLPERLATVAGQDFARTTYTEAVRILSEAKIKFTFPVAWGGDLQSEHERFLAEEVFQRPLIVTDYPKTLKPFYMRENDDGRTVAAMDILLPGIGEIIGGSQREERYEVLERRMLAAGLDLDTYRWYLDLRSYGSVPHAGFGLGFERLVQFVTGMANIRETIPFPRTPGHAEF
ncbi:MAG TPA: asparagine--tRNA ligase [Desulfurivibrionaceae bacterium]|nr:asparagine--tRNA ligase [Desulfurivibrionaceae bacterium]